MADFDKHRLYHLSRGSRCLADKQAEAVAYLLSDPRTEGDVLTLVPDLTPERLSEIKGDLFFQKRLAYIKDRQGRKKNKPRTLDQYEEFALRKLHHLACKARDEKVQAVSAEKLGLLVTRIKRDKAETGAPPSTNLDLSHLKEAFDKESE